MKKKKILNVVSVYLTIPFIFRNQLLYFADKYDITLASSPSEELPEFAQKNKAKHQFFNIFRSISPLQDVKTIIDIFAFIKKENFDVVVGHTPKGALLSMIAAFLAGTKKRVYFRHGLVYETSSGLKKQLMLNMERLTSWCATHVICVSPYLIEKSIEDNLSSAKKMQLLNIGSCNGVDCFGIFNPEKIIPETKKRIQYEMKVNDNEFVIGYAGRMVNDKGIPEIMTAFKKLTSKYDNIKLLLVGPFDNRDELDDSIKKEILCNPKISYREYVEDGLQYYFSLMDVFVMPTHREGLGNSILEASSMGIPVLASSHTGSKDALRDKITGFYILPNEKSIIEKLEKIIVNKALKDELGKNGRRFVVDNFSQEVIWKEIELKVFN